MYLQNYIAYDEDLDFIGPVEGWAREMEYCPTWIAVQGLSDKNSDGSSRKAGAARCSEGTPVYLFWEKENHSDLSAVAVYWLEPRRDSFAPGDQLGYLPSDLAEACVEDFLSEERRFGAIIRKIFGSEPGAMEVYLEILSFFSPEQRKNAARKQKDNCRKWRTENVKTFFSMCSNLPPDKILALEKVNMLDYGKLTSAKSVELLRIEGIDREALSIIRRHYPPALRKVVK